MPVLRSSYLSLLAISLIGLSLIIYYSPENSKNKKDYESLVRLLNAFQLSQWVDKENPDDLIVKRVKGSQNGGRQIPQRAKERTLLFLLEDVQAKIAQMRIPQLTDFIKDGFDCVKCARYPKDIKIDSVLHFDRDRIEVVIVERLPFESVECKEIRAIPDIRSIKYLNNFIGRETFSEHDSLTLGEARVKLEENMSTAISFMSMTMSLKTLPYIIPLAIVSVMFYFMLHLLNFSPEVIKKESVAFVPFYEDYMSKITTIILMVVLPGVVIYMTFNTAVVTNTVTVLVFLSYYVLATILAIRVTLIRRVIHRSEKRDLTFYKKKWRKHIP